MKLAQIYFRNHKNLSGRVPLVLLWLLGIPLPILFLIFLFRG
jgi:hypothetical protein